MSNLNCMGKLNLVTKACSVLVLWTAAAVALPAQTFTSIHSFDITDGDEPGAGLVQGANGKLYGTTEAGGEPNGASTIFTITPSGALTTIYTFYCPNEQCPDGANPVAAMIQSTDGNFYGTTFGGTGLYGTIFKVTPNGRLTTIYSFCPTGICADGYWPKMGVIQGTDGNFYGTTVANTACDYQYCGTVFKITPNGELTTIYNLCPQNNCLGGAEPEAGLVEGTDGSFYGTTREGGAYGYGVVFRITPSGTFTTLYSFCSQSVDGYCTDGAYPSASLILGSDGNFYGTTWGGGNGTCANYPGGCGTVFKITASGALTTLHEFDLTDGGQPRTSLVQGTDGNLYGTTSEGGANVCGFEGYGCGTIFKITPTGALTTLYNMCSQLNCMDGSAANALVQDTNGTFYGTTAGGGDYGYGTVFSLSVGLGAFVKTNPAAGKVGTSVGILGTNLTGATGVKFNGTATAFRLISSTFIEAKVPSGATTGKVTVQLPGGTLSSNVPFIVLR